MITIDEIKSIQQNILINGKFGDYIGVERELGVWGPCTSGAWKLAVDTLYGSEVYTPYRAYHAIHCRQPMTYDNPVVNLLLSRIVPPAVPPTFTTDLAASLHIAEGDTLTLTVAADGTPEPTFEWKKDNSLLSNQVANTFTKANVTGADSGNYWATATNEGGSVESTKCAVTVDVKPVLTTDLETTKSVNQGETLTLTVATSTAGATFQWYKDSTPIDGATDATYTKSGAVADDAASYYCRVTNGLSHTDSNTCAVTVVAKPVITTDLNATLDVNTGSALNLAIDSSTAGVTYQWFKDGSPIPDATSKAYSIPTAATTDSGTYKCTVTNGTLTTDSKDCVVTVADPS